GEGLAHHQGVRQAVLHARHGDLGAEAVEHAADAGVIPVVAVVGAGFVTHAGLPAAEAADLRLAVLLGGGGRALPRGALRAQAAGVVHPGLVELVIVAGAAAVRKRFPVPGAGAIHPVVEVSDTRGARAGPVEDAGDPSGDRLVQGVLLHVRQR